MMKLDTRQFQQSLMKFAAASKRAISDVIKQQAGLVAVRAALVHPPNASGNFGSPGTWAQQKRHLQEKIKAQNFGAKGPFMILPGGVLNRGAQASRKNGKGVEDIRYLFQKDGKDYFAPERNVIREANASRLSQFRRPFWSGGKLNAWQVQQATPFGPHSMRISKMIVSPGAATDWLAKQTKKIGRAKAGWVIAAAKTGVLGKLPEWVKKHSASAGSAKQLHNANFEGWEISNNVAHANRYSRADAVMTHAVNYQSGAMMRQVAFILNQECLKASKAGSLLKTL